MDSFGITPPKLSLAWSCWLLASHIFGSIVDSIGNEQMNKIATYAAIAACVKRRFGFVPKRCWIAHVKELNGLPVKLAPNRHDPSIRQVPCPPDKRKPIEACFRQLGLL